MLKMTINLQRKRWWLYKKNNKRKKKGEIKKVHFNSEGEGNDIEDHTLHCEVPPDLFFFVAHQVGAYGPTLIPAPDYPEDMEPFLLRPRSYYRKIK